MVSRRAHLPAILTGEECGLACSFVTGPSSDPSSESPSEEVILDWVARSKEGEEETFAHLVETFASQLQTIIYRMLLDWHETRDVAQETFIQAWRSLPRYEPRGKFQSWLFQIGVRKALDALRKRKRRPEFSGEGLTEIDAAARNQGMEDPTVARNEIIAAIEQAIQELSPEQRTAFVLSEYEGYGNREISEVIGGSAKSVEMHLYRARQSLRERLKLYLE